MILYTIFDPGFVMSDGLYDPQKNPPVISEMKVDGVMVQVSQITENELRVERIISTNPFDYLHAGLQPGEIIRRSR